MNISNTPFCHPLYGSTGRKVNGLPALGPTVLAASMPWEGEQATDNPIIHLTIPQGLKIAHAAGSMSSCTSMVVPALSLSTSSHGSMKLRVLEVAGLKVSIDAHPEKSHWTLLPGDVYMAVAENALRVKVSIEKLNAGMYNSCCYFLSNTWLA